MNSCTIEDTQGHEFVSITDVFRESTTTGVMRDTGRMNTTSHP
jgi:hypothetical protein